MFIIMDDEKHAPAAAAADRLDRKSDCFHQNLIGKGEGEMVFRQQFSLSYCIRTTTRQLQASFLR